jgi:hypothetical protein
MRIINSGHEYDLATVENGPSEHVKFINKKPDASGCLRTVHDGTTNEEVLAMLIDRMNYLQGLCPCRENAIVITKLEESLMWLNKRTTDRKARGVEGQHVK